MKKLQFECKLLTDVILNQKAATEGPNQTLDFIPGSNFLGIVASQIYKEKAEGGYDSRLMEIFHSGKVRFGDAHPSSNGCRGLKVPASMYYPKLKKASDICYIHHKTKHESAEIKKLQLKQCRTGFYCFDSVEAKPVEVNTTFAIKSAYDREKRRSMDEKMYGYQSLRKGLVMYFEVEVENDALADGIRQALVGDNKRVGRSRTAQFGLVSIKEKGFSQIKSQSRQGDEKYITIYADGRLIFLDEETGMPTFRPTPKQLGIDDEMALIRWDLSQVRTFQYAPWNYKRQCFDTDRVGIEKGSVFVVEPTASPSESCYVGSYCNEGFGRVIYNPEFLQAESDGTARYRLMETKNTETTKEIEVEVKSPLLQYVRMRQGEEAVLNATYKRVNAIVDEIGPLFRGNQFASQWGNIRNIASQNADVKSMIEEIEYYLSHGVAEKKWTEASRRKAFLDALNPKDEKSTEGHPTVEQPVNMQLLVVNLASQMAKECRKEVKK